MRTVDIIRKKRDGFELSEKEIQYFVREYTAGNIPDYQASALLMAICLKGMTPAETVCLTLSMRDSGDIADLSRIEGFKVDKHSTGGVGDKTTLVVAPVAAACGLKVAKMSGRSLGHTGGTIDKLESIRGFRTSIGSEEFCRIVNKAGLAVVGQSGNLAPADKKMYALRDVTATVESLPLIASSIMSKKLASGADGIVLDVKVGSGAFNKNERQALALAEAMTSIGRMAGKKTVALLTDMESPLGRTIGNALEVAEAIETLKGGGEEKFTELCVSVSALMLMCGGVGSEAHCRTLVRRVLKNGQALSAFCDMVEAQGGDTAVISDTGLLPRAECIKPVNAKKSGYIAKQDAELYGRASLILGAGRTRKEDEIDHSAGIVLNKKYGEPVAEGETIAFLHTNRTECLKEAEEFIESATEIGAQPPEYRPVIMGKV